MGPSEEALDLADHLIAAMPAFLNPSMRYGIANQIDLWADKVEAEEANKQ